MRQSRWGSAKAMFAMAALSTVIAGVAVVAPSPTAVSAATITFGGVQAQMANHRGQNSGTGGTNCIRYAPPDNSTSPAVATTFVVNPNEAITAHGSSGSCPTNLSTASQSAVGFSPSTQTSANDGTAFLIGRMTHYNNPINASDEFFTANLNIRLTSFRDDDDRLSLDPRRDPEQWTVAE